jgi:hypothetical protein
MFWGSNDIINAYNTYRYRFEMQDAKMEDFEDLIKNYDLKNLSESYSNL